MSLSAQDREQFADALAAGVPEDVVEEFTRTLTEYLDQWAQQVLAHVTHLEKPPQ